MKLIQELKTCNSDYCVVVGHHPVLSNGIYGPTPAIVEKIMPILEEHRIDAFLCGHDHSMQHLSYNRTEYILSGRGNLIAPWVPPKFPFDKVPEGSMKVYGEFIFGWGGFVMMEASQEQLATGLSKCAM